MAEKPKRGPTDDPSFTRKVHLSGLICCGLPEHESCSCSCSCRASSSDPKDVRKSSTSLRLNAEDALLATPSGSETSAARWLMYTVQQDQKKRGGRRPPSNHLAVSRTLLKLAEAMVEPLRNGTCGKARWCVATTRWNEPSHYSVFARFASSVLVPPSGELLSGLPGLSLRRGPVLVRKEGSLPPSVLSSCLMDRSVAVEAGISPFASQGLSPIYRSRHLYKLPSSSCVCACVCGYVLEQLRFTALRRGERDLSPSHPNNALEVSMAASAGATARFPEDQACYILHNVIYAEAARRGTGRSKARRATLQALCSASTYFTWGVAADKPRTQFEYTVFVRYSKSVGVLATTKVLQAHGMPLLPALKGNKYMLTLCKNLLRRPGAVEMGERPNRFSAIKPLTCSEQEEEDDDEDEDGDVVDADDDEEREGEADGDDSLSKSDDSEEPLSCSDQEERGVGSASGGEGEDGNGSDDDAGEEESDSQSLYTTCSDREVGGPISDLEAFLLGSEEEESGQSDIRYTTRGSLKRSRGEADDDEDDAQDDDSVDEGVAEEDDEMVSQSDSSSELEIVRVKDRNVTIPHEAKEPVESRRCATYEDYVLSTITGGHDNMVLELTKAQTAASAKLTKAKKAASAKLTKAKKPTSSELLTKAKKSTTSAQLTKAKQPTTSAQLTKAKRPTTSAHLTKAEKPTNSARLTKAKKPTTYGEMTKVQKHTNSGETTKPKKPTASAAGMTKAQKKSTKKSSKTSTKEATTTSADVTKAKKSTKKPTTSAETTKAKKSTTSKSTASKSTTSADKTKAKKHTTSASTNKAQKSTTSAEATEAKKHTTSAEATEAKKHTTSAEATEAKKLTTSAETTKAKKHATSAETTKAKKPTASAEMSKAQKRTTTTTTTTTTSSSDRTKAQKPTTTAEMTKGKKPKGQKHKAKTAQKPTNSAETTEAQKHTTSAGPASQKVKEKESSTANRDPSYTRWNQPSVCTLLILHSSSNKLPSAKDILQHAGGVHGLAISQGPTFVRTDGPFAPANLASCILERRVAVQVGKCPFTSKQLAPAQDPRVAKKMISSPCLCVCVCGHVLKAHRFSSSSAAAAAATTTSSSSVRAKTNRTPIFEEELAAKAPRSASHPDDKSCYILHNVLYSCAGRKGSGRMEERRSTLKTLRSASAQFSWAVAVDKPRTHWEYSVFVHYAKAVRVLASMTSFTFHTHGMPELPALQGQDVMLKLCQKLTERPGAVEEGPRPTLFMDVERASNVESESWEEEEGEESQSEEEEEEEESEKEEELEGEEEEEEWKDGDHDHNDDVVGSEEEEEEDDEKGQEDGQNARASVKEKRARLTVWISSDSSGHEDDGEERTKAKRLPAKQDPKNKKANDITSSAEQDSIDTQVESAPKQDPACAKTLHLAANLCWELNGLPENSECSCVCSCKLSVTSSSNGSSISAAAQGLNVEDAVLCSELSAAAAAPQNKNTTGRWVVFTVSLTASARGPAPSHQETRKALVSVAETMVGSPQAKRGYGQALWCLAATRWNDSSVLTVLLHHSSSVKMPSTAELVEHLSRVTVTQAPTFVRTNGEATPTTLVSCLLQRSVCVHLGSSPVTYRPQIARMERNAEAQMKSSRRCLCVCVCGHILNEHRFATQKSARGGGGRRTPDPEDIEEIMAEQATRTDCHPDDKARFVHHNVLYSKAASKGDGRKKQRQSTLKTLNLASGSFSWAVAVDKPGTVLEYSVLVHYSRSVRVLASSAPLDAHGMPQLPALEGNDALVKLAQTLLERDGAVERGGRPECFTFSPKKSSPTRAGTEAEANGQSDRDEKEGGEQVEKEQTQVAKTSADARQQEEEEEEERGRMSPSAGRKTLIARRRLRYLGEEKISHSPKPDGVKDVPQQMDQEDKVPEPKEVQKKQQLDEDESPKLQRQHKRKLPLESGIHQEDQDEADDADVVPQSLAKLRRRHAAFLDDDDDDDDDDDEHDNGDDAEEDKEAELQPKEQRGRLEFNSEEEEKKVVLQQQKEDEHPPSKRHCVASESDKDDEDGRPAKRLRHDSELEEEEEEEEAPTPKRKKGSETPVC